MTHRTEVTCLESNDTATVLFTAGADNRLRAFNINAAALTRYAAPTDALELATTTSTVTESDDGSSPADGMTPILELAEEMERRTKERAVMLRLDPRQRYLSVLSADKSLEIYRVRGDEDLKAKRRSKRTLKTMLLLIRHDRLASKARSFTYLPGWSIKRNESAKVAGWLKMQLATMGVVADARQLLQQFDGGALDPTGQISRGGQDCRARPCWPSRRRADLGDQLGQQTAADGLYRYCPGIGG